MAEAKTRSISFPRYAEYNCAFKYIVEQALGCKYVMPPPLTKRTMDLGTKHSPDFVCTPFKTMLGSMIESLEAGADTLLMTHGLCRLGYYGELLEQILRDLGYQFDFINLSEYDMSKKKEYIRIVRRINPRVNPARFLAQFMEGLRMVEYLDEITGEYYKNCGFDAMDGAYRRAYREFLAAMYTAQGRSDVESGYRAARSAFSSTRLDKPQRPLRVGIVGEFYTVMDAFSNLELEEKALLNTVEATAERHGVPFHDFNEDYAAIGLNESMFYDEHHLDALGASRFTRYFAGILTQRCPSLKTDRNDPDWAADLEAYHRALEALGG